MRKEKKNTEQKGGKEGNERDKEGKEEMRQKGK